MANRDAPAAGRLGDIGISRSLPAIEELPEGRKGFDPAYHPVRFLYKTDTSGDMRMAARGRPIGSPGRGERLLNQPVHPFRGQAWIRG